jgi:hypothetical protein
LAYYDPDTSCLRTSQGTFDGDSTPSSLTLPASGSMRSGAVYAHRRSALPTAANVSSSSLLLKTPTTQLAVNGGSQHPEKRKRGGHGPTLADEVEHLLPTPAARDFRSGKSNIMDRNSRPLNEVVVNLLPTPDTGTSLNGHGRRGGKKGNGHQSGASLDIVAQTLHGGSSDPPSCNGSTSLDSQHPGQLTIEDA